MASKIALVTGSSRGIGKAIALDLANQGADIVVNYRSRPDAAEEVANVIRGMGRRALVIEADVADDLQVKAMVDQAVQEFGGIDILITAAGVNKVNPIVEQPLEEWDMIMDANVKGTWLYCKEVGKVMIEQGRGGKVVLLGSARGELGMANYTGYSPSKGAVHLLAKSLGCEWGQYGINVNAIAPTVFRTALTQWMFDDDAFYKNFLKRIPIGRLGEPEDFIGTVIFLSSKASDFMTGTVLYVDGGYTAG